MTERDKDNNGQDMYPERNGTSRELNKKCDVFNKPESNKTNEQFFRDWEKDAFGYGYGTGEVVLIPLLRRFFAHCNKPENRSYDFRKLEEDLGKESTWFLINLFGQKDIIEYGSSPRFAWLTDEGNRLMNFVNSKTDEELYEIVMGNNEEDGVYECGRDFCNCDTNPTDDCPNPFWTGRVLKSSLDNKD